MAAPEGPEESRIKRIQAIVNVTQSGVYDPVTRAAVTLWQTSHQLRADGIVGPITARAMGIA
ncbi:peptidoglycan-binding domain-containing protein [Azospirillum sp. B506]|uniref:peptidoglycan-binding domain-containing protein n=1 Tax=Azospirillum sp. B506 TaxID=137721 RepID=UPI00244E1E42|nr:peptidoglycan-binding domain-containing protein [Azospirillum sp. B506]